MKWYTVYMEHTMRSVVEVVANSIDEAKSEALTKSFSKDSSHWEEVDTEFIDIDEGRTLSDEEIDDYE